MRLHVYVSIFVLKTAEIDVLCCSDRDMSVAMVCHIQSLSSLHAELTKRCGNTHAPDPLVANARHATALSCITH